MIPKPRWRRSSGFSGPAVEKHIVDCLPEPLRTANGLMPLGEALYQIHFPQSPDKLNRAEYRLKFDELLGIQLNIQSRRTLRKTRYDGFRFPRVGELFNRF